MSFKRFISMIIITASPWLMISNSANAAVPTFSCDGYPYQILSNKLYKLDSVTLTYTLQGSTSSPGLNGAGFNVLDNYAYALSSNSVYRLGSDGTRDLVSAGIGGAYSYVGTMDFTGNFYGLKRTNRKVLIKMDIAASEASGTTVYTEVTFSGTVTPPPVGDFVYMQNAGNEYILLVRGSVLYWYDFQTLTTYSVAATLPTGAPALSFGASWADDNGRIWGFHNATGDIYELLDPFGTNPTWVLIADLPSNGNNDGFSCSAANFPALPPVAQDDEFATKVETAFTGNLIDDNGNGPDEDPDGAAVTILWTDPSTTSPSNGVISATNSDGTFTYTPNAGFYGIDTFNYVLSDGGATDDAVVTINIPADNSDLPSSYVDAVHSVVSGTHLGGSVTLDTSPNSNASTDATGDTDNGLTSSNDFIYGQAKTISVDVSEAVTGSTYLQAWIDWDLDNSFGGSSEQVAINLTDSDGDGEISFTVNVPTTISSGDTFFRLRWSSELGLNVSDTAPDGEVEDYEIQLLAVANLTASKTVDVWDPSALGLYALPGNDVVYTITSVNAGDVPSDTDTVFLVDKIPSEVTFYNGDIDDAGPELNAVSYSETGVTGLTFNYATDVGYSTASTAPTTMAQCNDVIATGYVSNVTYICFNPKGQFLGGSPDPSFSVSFRANID